MQATGTIKAKWANEAVCECDAVAKSVGSHTSLDLGILHLRNQLIPARLQKGMDGDLVVLRVDPSLDPAAFAKGKPTIRGGKVIHSEP